MKKLITIVIVVILVVAFASPAFACGSRCGGNSAARYSVCATESCALTGLHTHNRTSYTGHYYGDGHTYHEYCAVEDCTLGGYHQHDDTYCFGRPQGGCCGNNYAGRGCR